MSKEAAVKPAANEAKTRPPQRPQPRPNQSPLPQQ
jgi:hypothetical protein